MFFADFCSFSKQLLVVQGRTLVAGLSLVESVYVLSYLFDEPAATDKLVYLQRAATVRTLLPLFNQPFSHAILTAQLAAAGTDHCIFNFTKANEALEDFIKILVRRGLLLFSLLLRLMP